MDTNYRKVIEFWPSLEAMADEVGARVEAVRKWKQRNRIPGNWWFAVAQSETGKQNGVTIEGLAEIAQPEPAE